jgi:hypothetical protein
MECGMERRFHRGFTAAEKTELFLVLAHIVPLPANGRMRPFLSFPDLAQQSSKLGWPPGGFANSLKFSGFWFKRENEPGLGPSAECFWVLAGTLNGPRSGPATPWRGIYGRVRRVTSTHIRLRGEGSNPVPLPPPSCPRQRQARPADTRDEESVR